MTLNELLHSWNLLRNGALGRGNTAPLVSRELAEEVADEYEAFRAWLAEQGPLDDLAASITAKHWITLQRELAARVRAQGQWAPDVARSPYERATDAVATTATAAGRGAMLAVVGLGVLGLAYALARGRR